jgi:hypothetical protein
MRCCDAFLLLQRVKTVRIIYRYELFFRFTDTPAYIYIYIYILRPKKLFWSFTINLAINLYQFSPHSFLLTYICLRRRFFVWPWKSRVPYCDIVMSQRGHWPLLIRTRYVCTCVGAGSGMGGGIRKIKVIRWGAYYVYFNVWHV